MNTSRVRLGLTALLLTPVLLFVYVAQAQDAAVPAPSDSATNLSDAGPGEGGDDADAGPPPLPAFDSTPFPEEKSPRPKKEEWKGATDVHLSEGSLVGSCKVQRVREWVRISCSATTAKMTLMGGNSEDVSMLLGPVPQDWGSFPEGGEMIFAVRRGDRRIFEWQGVEFGYRGANSVNNFLVISEMWLPWEDKPVILAR
ncbi:MAG TPA: hypothetical protein PK156_01665 [Polyangium sp.]|nr:hypothetical protein [Polyangium sp.]